VRLFEERLTVGGRVRFVSDGEQFSFNGTTQSVPEYKLYDAFANYRFSDNLTAFVTIENLSDEGYFLAKENTGQSGPGRTVMGGFTTSF
jgi:hemoglobin/transferrin/lactoferrin receptor protein